MNRQAVTHDMIGKTFGKWLVLKVSPKSSSKYDCWLCRCGGCGIVKNVYGTNLRRGLSKSCRKCFRNLPNIIDLTGQTFGLWRVIECAGQVKRPHSTMKTMVMWRCECTGCGTVRLHGCRALRSGHSRGCRSCKQKRDNAEHYARYCAATKDFARKCGLPEDTPFGASRTWDALASVGVPVSYKELAAAFGIPVQAAQRGVSYLWRNGLAVRQRESLRTGGARSKYHLSIRSLEILEKRANG